VSLRSARSCEKLFLDQPDGLGQGVDRGPGQGVTGVQQPLQVRTGAREGAAELVDHHHQVAAVHRVDQPVQVEQEGLDVQRRAGPVAGDPVAVGEERAALGPRLEVDVLLPDCRPVLDHGIGVTGDRDTTLEPEVDVHPVVGEAEPVDPADGDAPVRDLGVLEDPA
jgi:hypothetical protein